MSPADGMVSTERGRELVRLWAEGRDRIVAALPGHLPDIYMRRPDRWLEVAWRTVNAPELAGAAPAGLVKAMVTAAGDGLCPQEGRIVVAADGGATWLPHARSLKLLLMRCDPGIFIRMGVARDGDAWRVDRSADGAIRYLSHAHGAPGGRGDWHHVYADAALDALRRKSFIVLDRAEAEAIAAADLHLPAPEDSAESARRVALIRLALDLKLEPGWSPVRRFWRAVFRIWGPAP